MNRNDNTEATDMYKWLGHIAKCVKMWSTSHILVCTLYRCVMITLTYVLYNRTFKHMRL